MAWNTIEAERLRDFPWGRIVLGAGGLALIGSLMAAAAGRPAVEVGRISVGGATGWFLLLTVTYAVRLRRNGNVVFPAPWWRNEGT